MADSGIRSEPSLKDQLFAEPYAFEFYQAAYLIERLNADAPSLGMGNDFEREALEVTSRVSMAPPPSDIYGIATQDKATKPPYVLQINFMGLAGLQGPLPQGMTDRVIDQVRQKEYTLRDFLDIFNHRLVSLNYRIAKKYSLALNRRLPQETAVGRCLSAFSGKIMASVPCVRHDVDRSLLKYAGLLWQQPRTKRGLEKMLTDFFHCPFHVVEWVGMWRELDPEDVTHVGQGGQWNSLGEGAVLGKHVWDHQNKFILMMEATNVAMLEDFIPSGKSYELLMRMVTYFVGPIMSVDVVIVVGNNQEIQPRGIGRSMALGWTAVLGPVAHGMKVKVCHPV